MGVERGKIVFLEAFLIHMLRHCCV